MSELCSLFSAHHLLHSVKHNYWLICARNYRLNRNGNLCKGTWVRKMSVMVNLLCFGRFAAGYRANGWFFITHYNIYVIDLVTRAHLIAWLTELPCLCLNSATVSSCCFVYMPHNNSFNISPKTTVIEDTYRTPTAIPFKDFCHTNIQEKIAEYPFL